VTPFSSADAANVIINRMTESLDEVREFRE
jgi:hypothetical protein